MTNHTDFDDEPPPNEEELRAAGLLADALDGARPVEPGSLAETALRARASAEQPAPLDPAIVRRGVEQGLSRRSRARRVVALSAFAAAAIAIAGWVAVRSLSPAPSRSETSRRPHSSSSPALSAVPIEPFPEDQRTSDRIDQMARLAAADWLTGALAEAHSAEPR